jgi:hypothetical protein
VELEVRCGPTSGRGGPAKYESSHPGGKAALAAICRALTTDHLHSDLVGAGWTVSVMCIETRTYKVPCPNDGRFEEPPNLRVRRTHFRPVMHSDVDQHAPYNDLSHWGDFAKVQTMTPEERTISRISTRFETIFKTPICVSTHSQQEWTPWITHGSLGNTKYVVPFDMAPSRRRGVRDTPTARASVADGLRAAAHAETRTGINRNRADTSFEILSERTTWRLELVVPHQEGTPEIRVHMTLNPHEDAIVFEVETVVPFTRAEHAYPRAEVLIDQVARTMWIVFVLRHWLRGWWGENER